jgi:acyl-CoA synthetase (AMP-forming)/AMP-acid ligase II
MVSRAYADPGGVGLVEAVWGADLLAVHDDRIAVIDLTGDGERRRTRRELALSIVQIAQRLRSSGIVEGDVVGLIMENSIEFIAAFHGVLAAGAVVLPLDPRSTVTGWIAGLTDNGVEAVIAGESQWHRLASENHVVRHAIVVGATPDQGWKTCWPLLCPSTRRRSAAVEREPPSSRRPAAPTAKPGQC